MKKVACELKMEALDISQLLVLDKKEECDDLSQSTLP